MLAVFGVAAHTRTVVLPIIGIVTLTTAEDMLTFDADVAGGRLHGWLGSCPNLLCLWRHDRTTLALLSSVVCNI